MRVAVLLAGLAAAYATNDATPTDNNVCAELAALMEQKLAAKMEASAAVDRLECSRLLLRSTAGSVKEELKDADFILAHMSSSNGPGKKAWEPCTDFKCTASSIVEGKQDSATYKRSCERVLQWFPLDKMCNARYILDRFLPFFNVPASSDELRMVELTPTWRATPGENLGSAGWNLIGALVKGNVLPVSAMIEGVPKYITSFENAPFRVEAPRDLAKLLYAELAQSLHVDPMDVGLTIDVATIICNLFFLDQMNPPATYDYPKDWEAKQAALVAAAAKAAAAEDEGEDLSLIHI